ncbi:MAG: hypothetical protein ACPL7J_14250, partial [Desulfomonilaceae bacterium]
MNWTVVPLQDRGDLRLLRRVQGLAMTIELLMHHCERRGAISSINLAKPYVLKITATSSRSWVILGDAAPVDQVALYTSRESMA